MGHLGGRSVVPLRPFLQLREHSAEPCFLSRPSVGSLARLCRCGVDVGATVTSQAVDGDEASAEGTLQGSPLSSYLMFLMKRSKLALMCDI